MTGVCRPPTPDVAFLICSTDGRHNGVMGERRTPGWLLSELAAAGRENLDPAHVDRYDAKEDADARAEVELLEAQGVTAASTVVDLGAGTGQFTVMAAQRFGRVVAVDVSPVMLASLRAKVAAAGLNNVEVVEAGFLSYDHQLPLADAVYSRYALHHLPDFWKGLALQRIHAILKPGGCFRLWDVVFNFDPLDAPDRIEAWCSSGGDDVGSQWLRAELEEHIRDEYSTYTWLLEPLVTRAGFHVTAADYSGDGFFAKYLFRRL